MNILLAEENEEIVSDNNNKKENNNSTINTISKCFKGIYIYFKEYILFLKGSTFRVLKILNYATYHWGFQMILFIGMTQTYGAVNVMAEQFAPYLVKEGEIE